jgi:hypothetical protein
LACSAKYIEGLENRLGRMESLLRKSGLLSEDDDRTDLATIEKRLAEQVANGKSKESTPAKSPGGTEPACGPSASDGHNPPPHKEKRGSSGGPSAAPNGQKQEEEDVEALSDLMCSLVTNNCGETRFIGANDAPRIAFPLFLADTPKAHLLDGRSSPPGAYSG